MRETSSKEASIIQNLLLYYVNDLTVSTAKPNIAKPIAVENHPFLQPTLYNIPKIVHYYVLLSSFLFVKQFNYFLFFPFHPIFPIIHSF